MTLELGILGLNEGNGHPFSYAAIFNGYDPEALERRCPFALIKEYLPAEHRNENGLDNARVTHVWTQDAAVSSDVAAVSLIPNVVTDYRDMIGKVDAVILARDDPWNHLAMARPFLEAGVPLFIDKQLTATVSELDELLGLLGPDSRLMAGSPARYTRDLDRARADLPDRRVRSIHGMSRVSWLRYGHHLFEGIVCLYGLDIAWVRSLSNRPDHDIVQIEYTSGPSVILELIADVHLPIAFTCFSADAPPYTVPFTDFFHSFREMLARFVHLVETGEPAIPRDEIVGISRVVLAGVRSKELGGRPIRPDTLQPTAVAPC